MDPTAKGILIGIHFFIYLLIFFGSQYLACFFSYLKSKNDFNVEYIIDFDDFEDWSGNNDKTPIGQFIKQKPYSFDVDREWDYKRTKRMCWSFTIVGFVFNFLTFLIILNH